MYKAQAISENFVHGWDESLGEPFIVVNVDGIDVVGEAMSQRSAEEIAAEWNLPIILRQLSKNFKEQEILIPNNPTCKAFNGGYFKTKEVLEYLADMLE